MIEKKAVTIIELLRALNGLQAGIVPGTGAAGETAGMVLGSAAPLMNIPQGRVTASDRTGAFAPVKETARLVPGLSSIVSPMQDWSEYMPSQHRDDREMQILNQEISKLMQDAKSRQMPAEEFNERSEHLAAKLGLPEYMGRARPEYATKAFQATLANHMRNYQEQVNNGEIPPDAPIPALDADTIVGSARSIYAPGNPTTTQSRLGEFGRNIVANPVIGAAVLDRGAPTEQNTLGEKLRAPLGLASIGAQFSPATMARNPRGFGVAKNVLTAMRGTRAQGLMGASKLVSAAHAMTDPNRRAAIEEHENLMKERWGANQNRFNNLLYQAGRLGRAGLELSPVAPVFNPKSRFKIGFKANPAMTSYWTGSSATKGLANSILTRLSGKTGEQAAKEWSERVNAPIVNTDMPKVQPPMGV